MAVATISLFDFVTDSSDVAVPNAKVRLTFGYNAATTADGLLQPSVQEVITDSTGKFTFSKVIPNDLISPANTVYLIETPFRSYLVAPQSGNGSSQQSTAANVIVNNPLALAPYTGLTSLTVSGNLTVTGNETLTGNETVGGTLGVTGLVTASGGEVISGGTGATLNASGDLAVRSVTVSSGSGPYAPNLPGASSVATPAGVTTGKVWDYGGELFHNRASGAKNDGVTDDTVANQATIAAAQTAGGIAFIGSGGSVTGQLNITARVSLRSTGRDTNQLLAKTGASGPLINVNMGVQSSVDLRDFGIDMTSAPAIEAILLNNVINGVVDQVSVVNGGTNGIHYTATNLTSATRMVLWDQSNAGVLIHGDDSAELSFTDINIRKTLAGTLAAGFEVDRVNSADVGAYYLYNVRVTRAAGSITNGCKFNETGGSASGSPVFMIDCIFDNIDGGIPGLFTKQIGAKIINCWFTCAVGSSQPALRFDGGQGWIVIGNTFIPTATGVCIDFINAPTIIVIEGNFFQNGTALNMPAANPPTAITLGVNIYANSTVTNDFGKLATAISTSTVIGAIDLLTSGSGGSPQSLGLRDAGSGKHKWIRIDSAANLQLLNDAFGAVIIQINDSGIITQYNAVATAGQGLPPIVASYINTALVAAVANAINFMPPAAVGGYRLRIHYRPTATGVSTSVGVTVTYKDSTGAISYTTIPFTRRSTAALAAPPFLNTGADDFFVDFPFEVDNSATPITVSTTGTFTGTTYNLAATLERLA